MTLAGIDCIGYVRVSTEQQAGETRTSLADQERAIDALATKLGVTVQRWYRDEGASGASVAQRPALSQLLADCAAHPRKRPGLVLVLNDSRWGRFPNPEESTYWRFHLERVGWMVRFAEGDDTHTLTVRNILRSVVASTATQKREDVRANAKRGSRGTAAQGFWATREPYGYRRTVVFPPGRERVLTHGQRKAIDEKVILTPDPEEAAVVRELFTRYATGTDSLASLVDWLVTITPRRWTRAAVRFTLSNPAYVGDVVSGRTSADSTHRSAQPEGAWVITRDAHQAIVGRTLFAAAQAVLARNGTWTARVRSSWILSGLVRCPCGQPYVAGGGNRTPDRVTASYRCVTKVYPTHARCPFPGSIKKEWLEAAMLREVGRVVGAPAHRARIARRLEAILRELRNTPAPATAQLEREIAEARRSRDRLVAAVADGTLTSEEARGHLDDVRRLLARLEAAHAPTTTADAAEPIEAERDRMLALAVEFRRAATTLRGPALRELLRPWIARAVFDPRDRTLTLDIRHIPVMAYGDLTHMPSLSSQDDSSTWHTRRTVVVGAP